MRLACCFSADFSVTNMIGLLKLVLSPSLNLNQQQTILPACEPYSSPVRCVRACFSCPSKALGEPDLRRPFLSSTQEERCCHPTSRPAPLRRRGWDRTHFLITSVYILIHHQLKMLLWRKEQTGHLREGADRSAERAEKEQQQKQHVLVWRGGPAITQQKQLGTSFLSRSLHHLEASLLVSGADDPRGATRICPPKSRGRSSLCSMGREWKAWNFSLRTLHSIPRSMHIGCGLGQIAYLL